MTTFFFLYFKRANLFMKPILAFQNFEDYLLEVQYPVLNKILQTMTQIFHFLILTQIYAATWRNPYSSFFGNDKYACSPGACSRYWNDWYLADFKFCVAQNYHIVVLEASSPNESKFIYGPDTPVSKTRFNFDLYFMGEWAAGESVVITYEGESYTTLFESPVAPAQWPFTSNFCDNKSFQILSTKFTRIQAPSFRYVLLNSQTALGMVAIKNAHATFELCNYNCKSCVFGESENCNSCYFGTPDVNGKCQVCPPETPNLQLMVGCASSCVYGRIPDARKVCVDYIGSNKFGTDLMDTNMHRFWTEILDPDFLQSFLKRNIALGTYFLGDFTTRAGTMIPINFVNAINILLPMQVHVQFYTFGTWNTGSGVSLYVDNVYYGAVYYENGFKVDRFTIVEDIYYPLQTYKVYQGVHYIKLTLARSLLPTGKKMFRMMGNLTNPATEAWGLRYFVSQSGFCHSGCEICTLADQCVKCAASHRIYRERCYTIATCPPDSLANSTHCVAYDSEDKYSKYIVQAFYDFTLNDDSHDPFEIVNQIGINFQKGPNIQTSFTFSKIVLGGPYILAQASLRKDYIISDPHYAITVYFTIIFGSAFPTESYLNYKFCSIDESTTFVAQQSIYRSSFTFQANVAGNSDLEPHVKIKHRFGHLSPLTDLRVYVECVGANNDLYNGYCAVSDYFIVVHYCHPFCVECDDDDICLTWGSSYIAGITVFSQSECNQGYYFDRPTFTCQNCDHTCLSCNSRIQCIDCAPTYTKYLLDCVCLSSQFDFDNSCHGMTLSKQDCPTECVSCFNQDACSSCDPNDHKILINFQCECITGFYKDSNKICQPCHRLCKSCFGPLISECNDCLVIPFFSLQGNTCQCQQTNYFSEVEFTCQPCHFSCLSCYGPLANNCLDCQSPRLLEGLSCECGPGMFYHSITDACEACSQTNDGNIGCQKECENGYFIWHNQSCPEVTCPFGFLQNTDNRCLPVCGDGLVVGFEQCDDQNLVQFDGCHNCRFQCEQKCQTCDSNTVFPCSDVCGDLIVSGAEDCDDGNNEPYDGCFECRYQCQQECTLCLEGKCYECNTYGWKVEASNLACVENCGDSLIVNREECDDNNQNPDDGCHLCRFQCHSNCLLCNDIGNVCLSCDIGFSPSLYYCIPTCGDGYLAANTIRIEQCDDFNTVGFDGCSNTCQFQCQPIAICTTCVNQICQACAQYYELYPNRNQCLEICGDATIIGNENCEDLNSQMYDGCYKCRYQCHKNCSVCSLGKCTQCLPGYKLNLFNLNCDPVCGDRVIVSSEQCDDGNKFPGDGCFNCRFECSHGCEFCVYQLCLQCEVGFSMQTPNSCVAESLISAKAQHYCLLGQYLNAISNRCSSICGDGIKAIDEDCDDQYSENCKDCQLICGINCLFCENGRCLICQHGFQLTVLNLCESIWREIIVDNGHKLIETYQAGCELNCYFCLNQQCLICEKNWEINFIDGMCYPICGDGTLVGNESCEDANDDPEDGCYLCQLTCPRRCQQCINNICKECKEAFYLTPRNTCIDLVKCEDTMGYLSEKCLNCIQGRCLECELGWYVTKQESCATLCGDGIHVLGFEQCDDGNDSPYDGCYDCQLECDSSCQLCEEGICICNQLGWYELTDQCQPRCGDEIVVAQEQCDDGNEIQFDGCYDCMYQCDPFCKECFEGICSLCNYELELNSFMRCQSICGDAIVSLDEECDDGNIVNGDGCDSQCKIQDGWKCENLIGQGSYCDVRTNTRLQLVLLSSSYETCKVQITFSQQIKSETRFEFERNFKFAIKSASPQSYRIETSPLQEPSKDLSTVEYHLNIQFLSQLDNPQLVVQLLQNGLIDKNGNKLNEQQEVLKLSAPKLMDSKERQLASAGQDLNNYILYGLGGIALLAILTNNLDLIANLLDNLQQLSYLQFINIQFPENLDIYFSTFQLVSMEPIVSYLGLHQYLEKSINYPYLESSGKLKFYKVNSFFLANIDSLIIQIVIGLAFQFCVEIIILFVNAGSLKFYFTPTKVKLYLFKLKDLCFAYLQLYQKSIFTKVIQANAYDLLFASILQIQVQNQDSGLVLLNRLASIGVLILYFTFILQKMQLLMIKKDSIGIIVQQDIFFYGLKISNFNTWIFNYNSLLIIKKLVFCFFIISFQSSPLLQITLLSFQASIFAFYLLCNQPFVSRTEQFKLIITETAISFSTLMMSLFDENSNQKYYVQLKIGWLLIGLLSSIMIYNLIVDTYQGMKKIYDAINNKINKTPNSVSSENRQWI